MHSFQIYFMFLRFLQSVNSWDPDYLTNLLIPLCKFAHMEELLWFPSQNLSAEDSTKVEKTMLAMEQSLQITQMVFTNRSDIRITESSIQKMYIGMVFTTSLDDPILYIHDRVLLGKRLGVSMLVPMNLVDDFKTVKRYVKDMYRRNFHMSLLYVQNSNQTNCLWGYNIFPEFAVDNRTDIWGWLLVNVKSIQDASLDTKGHTFKTSLRLDVPYLFPFKHATGEVTLQGTSYKMIEQFIKFINASLVDYEMPRDKLGGQVIDMRAALSLVREKKIDFLATAYALFAIDDEIDKSYPLMVVKWCLMVPIWNTVSTFYYPLQPFDVVVWLLFIATFLALVAIDVLQTLWQQIVEGSAIHQKHRNSRLLQLLSASIFNDFCFVINISTGKTLKKPATLLRAFILMSVFFYGFFLNANYSTLLGSILTVSLFHEDINSMEDLIRANVSVMIIDYELEFLLAGGNDLDADFLKLLHVVGAATFSWHQLSLNASFAYFVTEDKWHFIRAQQDDLKQDIFKFTDICFGSHHLAYPMQKDSPIWRSLEYYIFRMHSSGMLTYYESASFDHAVHAGLIRRLNGINKYTSAGLEHLFMVFMMLLMVCAFSCMIFLGEVFYVSLFKSGEKLKRINKSRMRFKLSRNIPS